MQRFIKKAGMVAVVMVAVGLGLSLTAGTCAAADPRTDMRAGKFNANWCGFEAVIDIQPQPSLSVDKALGIVRRFKGTIKLPRTGEVNPFYLYQYVDGHLDMERSVSGTQIVQTMVTHLPQIDSSAGGGLRVNFAAKATAGHGAKLLGYVHMPIADKPAKKTYLTLISLKCVAPNEGNDTPELRVHMPNGEYKKRWENVNAGMTLKITLINKRLMTRDVSVQLWEIDSGSADDKLGVMTIKRFDTGEKTHFFSSKEGTYVLKYRVDEE